MCEYIENNALNTPVALSSVLKVQGKSLLPSTDERALASEFLDEATKDEDFVIVNRHGAHGKRYLWKFLNEGI